MDMNPAAENNLPPLRKTLHSRNEAARKSNKEKVKEVEPTQVENPIVEIPLSMDYS